MTACREYLDLLSMSLDQPLSPEARTRLDSHLAQCPECRTAQKELQRTHSQLKGLRPVEPPPWLASKIMARVRAEAPLQDSFWRRFLRPMVMRPQFQVASILLLAATGFYLMKSQRPGQDVFKELERSQAPATPQSQPQKSEAAQAQLTPGSRSGLAEKPTTAPDSVDQVLQGDSKPSESGFALSPKYAPPPPPAPAPTAPAAQLGLAKEEKDRARPEPPPSLEASKPTPEVPSVRGGAIPVLAESAAAPASKKGSRDAENRATADHEDRSRRADEASRQKAAEATGQLQAQAAPKEKSDDRIWAIRLDMPQPESARPLIERELARIGATLLPRRDSDASRMLRARLDPRRMPELVSRLARVGRVLEQPDLSGGEPSMIAITIRW
ncbi:MAG: zf-HC2 domain-containing protein [Holophagaceae bacterium]|nr:zf-HC2 domain-containing protein [Holophagaceae bacterium]